MNSTECKQFEVEIVDDILGSLSSPKSRRLHEHLAQCKSCRKIYEDWHEILSDDTTGAPTAGLYRHLKKVFLYQQLKGKLLKPSIIWGASFAAIVGIIILSLTAIKVDQPLNTWEHLPVASDELPLFVTDDAETVHYLINPQKDQLNNINGIIWVNNRQDEAYCFVQNLEANTWYDYQIWLIKPTQKENGGLLQVVEKYGKIHLQQRNIQDVQQISISREPKGGSFYPTSNDIILIDFNLHQLEY